MLNLTPITYAADETGRKASTTTNQEICNAIAMDFLSHSPVEVKCDAGLSEFATVGTLMTIGFTDTWKMVYEALLTSLNEHRSALKEATILQRREIELTISIVEDYIKMMDLNKQHRRVSLFMPPNLVDPQDAIDAIGFVFGNLNSLIVKGYKPDVVAQRFKFYVMPGDDILSFIDGAIAELKRLINQYSESGADILYPSIRQLDDIIDSKKLDAIVKELPTLIGDGHADVISEFQAQIQRYVEFVTTTLRPPATAESFLPQELYLTYLRLYGVYDTPEQLIDRAKKDWDIYYKRYQDLALQIAQDRELSETDPAKIVLALEQEARSVDTKLVMERYEAAQAQMEEYIKRDNLMTLPGRPIRMRVGTAAEEATFPVPHVITPNFIGNTGTVWPEFVLCDLAGNSSPMTADPLIVHEGRPGHDLQFSRMVELYLEGKLNLIEIIIASNSANAEGWAHYAEYLMTDYMPLESQLAALKDQLLRIGRMFLDPQLNSQQIGFDDVVKFMKEKVGFDSMATAEAKRYSFQIPGQATSYRYGAIKIMDLRDKLCREMGDMFKMQKFHDAILSFGLLPVDLYADLIKNRMAEL
ncbi:DUF885 family protein [Candidatus Odyssella acanthamoebae]|uniref:DUF885 domain-containing protein n=1 Tax=Candidatus Odyssella acanthamoebae TaxID=91604 RepID=A0A077AVC8_9PROT|nr:DUF885 family protein [Candidatus Paracaedibacter acanthamoebae]AIK95989.1 hypothetical protein ID47_03395 [Candidatus Paracaedibacter acanthamoebae]